MRGVRLTAQPNERKSSNSSHSAPRAVSVESASAGDLVAVAGIDNITIGPCRRGRRHLPIITVDEYALSMTIGINTSPRGRMVIDSPLDVAVVGLVMTAASKFHRPTAQTREVLARGELQLAVLIETMRREASNSLSVNQRSSRTIDEKRHEPVERVTIDVQKNISVRSRNSSPCAAGMETWQTMALAGYVLNGACERFDRLQDR